MQQQKLKVNHQTYLRDAERARTNIANIAQGLPIEQICPETFPLTTLAPILRRLAKEITNGRGFVVLRGVEPRRYSKFKNIVIYVGIASYIGNRFGRQDEYGNMLREYAKL
jgi:hypothetical protein